MMVREEVVISDSGDTPSQASGGGGVGVGEPFDSPSGLGGGEGLARGCSCS